MHLQIESKVPRMPCNPGILAALGISEPPKPFQLEHQLSCFVLNTEMSSIQSMKHIMQMCAVHSTAVDGTACGRCIVSHWV